MWHPTSMSYEVRYFAWMQHLWRTSVMVMQWRQLKAGKALCLTAECWGKLRAKNKTKGRTQRSSLNRLTLLLNSTLIKFSFCCPHFPGIRHDKQAGGASHRTKYCSSREADSVSREMDYEEICASNTSRCCSYEHNQTLPIWYKKGHYCFSTSSIFNEVYASWRGVVGRD